MTARLAVLLLLVCDPAARAEPAPVRITGAYELKADGRIVRLPARPPPTPRPADRPR